MSTMGLSLTESAKLSQDLLKKGVIECFVANSVVMDRLPFMEVSGNSLAYNIVDELPTVEFRGVNEAYTESGATVSRKHEFLFMLGGDVDVDMFIQATRGNINDIRGIQTELKVKSLENQFTKTFFYGDGTKSFKGLKTRIEDGIGTKIEKTLTMPRNIEEAFVIEDALTELCMAVKGGQPDVIYADAKSVNIFTRALNLLGYNTGTGADNFGKPCVMFKGCPIIVVPDALTEGDVFAVKFGADEYVSGLTNKGVQARDLGEAHDKPVLRTRVEFYVGLATFHNKSFAVLTKPEMARKK